MSAPPTPRNAPCPCGSGKRFKECHGRIGVSQEPPSVASVLQRALGAHQRGALEEAERLYREVLDREPRNAVATHYLGLLAWHRGDPVAAEAGMRASIEADAGIPDFHNNLGLLLRDTGRVGDAITAFERALGADPTWFEAYNNLGLALESLGQWDEARAAYEEALARQPGFAVARQNLARLLLAQGRFARGWEEYRWRLLAQGLLRSPPPSNAARLPDNLAGSRLLLAAEQGVGDVLFFLRFAPELVRRGAMLAFQGDRRLHGMLARTGLFEGGLAADGEKPAAGERVLVGDLPWLLQAHDPARLPPPLPLQPLPERTRHWRDRLGAANGLVGVAWRAGTTTPGPTRTQLKQIPLEALAACLQGQGTTLVSVQRHPVPGERERLEALVGRPVVDASAANDDLEDILALMALLDDYVGASSANVHLRAGCGGPMRVMVPFPPEWRWGVSGDASPWFPTARLIRQDAGGPWPGQRDRPANEAR